jgi:hypothetical protein
MVRTAPDGALFCEIWSTDAAPAPIAAAEPDPTLTAVTVPPWSRRTARMAFILVDGCFTAELLDSLGSDVLGGLLHDPMNGET